MEKYCSFDQAKTLAQMGCQFKQHRFGDVFYTMHPGTKEVNRVIVGSAMWFVSEHLPMFRAANMQDLMLLIGDKYAVSYDPVNDVWVALKELSCDFTNKEHDYVCTMAIAGANSCPIDLLFNLIISTD